MFVTHYKKPDRLSDPYRDYPDTGALLSKNDDELGWLEYRLLFGPYLPAGTYEEVMYYLPKAFEHLKHHAEDALEFVSAIFGFCSINIEKLKEDGLELTIRQEILDCLLYWCRTFTVIHFDKVACAASGRNAEYMNFIDNCQIICEGITELVRFQSLKTVAVEFVEWIADFQDDINRASWFLELSCEQVATYTPFEDEEICRILADKELLDRAYEVVWERILYERVGQTYWRDTLNHLGL
jgi:hypothetical protein